MEKIKESHISKGLFNSVPHTKRRLHTIIPGIMKAIK